MIQRDFTITEEQEACASTEELQFIFSQAEKKIIDSNASADIVLSRSVLLLTICIAISTSLIGVLVSSYNNSGANLLNVSYMAYIGYLALVILLLVYNISGHKYHSTGSAPSALLHSWFFDTYPLPADRLKGILISEIKSYQRRIIENKPINTKRWKLYGIALKLTIGSPFIYLIAYFLLRKFLS